MKATKHFILALATILLQPKAVWGQEPTDISGASVTVNNDKVILPNGTTWSSTWENLPLVVRDGSTTLAIGTDYDMKVFSTEESANNDEESTDVVTTIESDGIYYARITGKVMYTGKGP